MRWVFVGLVAASLAGAGVWYWWWPREALVRNYPSAGTDVVLFGDSLAYGIGATKGHDLSSDLAAAIGRPVINLGHPGDTTKDALTRIGKLSQYKPKVVIIILGGNDYLQHLSMNQAFANLAKLVNVVEAQGAIAVVVGFRLGPVIGNFDGQFAALAHRTEAAYVPDVLDGILGNKSLLSDNVHPNDLGYALMSRRIEPVLTKLLR